MQALKQFVGGRLDEDELIAQCAIDGHEPGFVWGRDDTADARQAARWNPWRVLGSCVGKRLMLSAHQNVGPGVARRPGAEDVHLAQSCSTCGSIQNAVAWPCNTLKILALDWVEHVECGRPGAIAPEASHGRPWSELRGASCSHVRSFRQIWHLQAPTGGAVTR